MELPASRSLKIAYALTILAAVVPIGIAKSGWVALATGSGAMGFLLLGPLLMLLVGVYRLITIFRNPAALSSYAVVGIANLLRKLGIFVIYVGAIVGVIGWVSGPLMAAFMKHRSENGVEFFVVGTYLALLGGIGMIGIFSFEFSRLLGMENHFREQPDE